MTAPREHRWGRHSGEFVDACEREGCTILVHRGSREQYVAWQAKKRGRYHYIRKGESIPPCTGKEEARPGPERMTDAERTIRDALPKDRQGSGWARCAESSIEVCNQLEEAIGERLSNWSPANSPAEVVYHLANQLEDKDAEIAALKEAAAAGGCLLAGPGRGDCEHAVGLPGRPISGQHDGPDDAVDAYGKPNGWCWMCWRGHQLSEARAELARLKPSGQVAEDQATVQIGIPKQATEQMKSDAWDAVARLAEAAQGYAAAVVAMAEDGAESQDGTSLAERIEALSEDRQEEKARAERAEAERDDAVADNAAKDEAFRLYVEEWGVSHEDVPGTEISCPQDDTCECPRVLALNKAFGPGHPGAALLKEHQELTRLARLGLHAYHGTECTMGDGGSYPSNPAECADPVCVDWAKTLEDKP